MGSRSANQATWLIQQPHVLLWAYLLAITCAEIMTSLVSPQLGQSAHVLLLISLLLHSAVAPAGPQRRMTLALALAPLIRILSLAMPLLQFPQLAWYPIVAIPLLIATGVVIYQLRLSRNDIGIRADNISVQILLAGLGTGLGLIEFALLKPTPLLTTWNWTSLSLAALNLLIFTGFSEELIFRGVLQTLAISTMGRRAIIYVALLFGVLHIGYLSFLDVIFVSAVGLLFGMIVYWSGSILGVTLAHGLTNIILFLVLPYLQQHPEHPLNSIILWATSIASLLGILAIGLLIKKHQTKRVAKPQVAALPALGAQIKAHRTAQRLTYVTLAQRSGIAARLLAEIEMGLHHVRPREIPAIAAALGISPESLRFPEVCSQFFPDEDAIAAP